MRCGLPLSCLLALFALSSGDARAQITQIIDATGDGAGNALDAPRGIDVDASGNVYVTGQLSDNAFEITPAGAITEIIDSTAGGSGFLSGAFSIAVGQGGSVYVSGEFSNNAFQIAPGGTITQIINASGDGAGNGLSLTFGISVDSAANAYVVGASSNNAFKITPGGVVTEIIDSTGDGAGNSLLDPLNTAVDSSGNVYVSGGISDNVFKITPGGDITEIIDETGDGAGNVLDFAHGLAVDSSGNVYVAGASSDNAFKITPGGMITEIIDATGDGAGNPLSSPNSGVAVDVSGNVYVTGFFSDNAFKITPDGTITQIIDASGDGAGNVLDAPGDVAVDSAGNVYVSGGNGNNAFKIAPDCFESVVVPRAATSVDASSRNSIPFGWPPPNNAFRYQQVFDATEFPCPQQPRQLVGIHLRPDVSEGPDAYSIPLDIRLSTTSQSVEGLSTVFADNVGGDDTLAYSGTFPLSTAATGPPGGPLDFDIEIEFQTPFVYTPAAGNLLVNVQNFGGSNTASYLLDALPNAPGDAVARAWSSDPYALSGVEGSSGLVMRFIVVPEPAGITMLVPGVLLLAALHAARSAARRRR